MIFIINQTSFFDSNIRGTEFGNPDPKPKFDGTEFGNPSKIQKGPFARDSVVQIQELDEHFQINGNVYLVSVEDHLGSFSLPANLKSELIEIKSTGFYFNEVIGGISSAQITLGSYSSLKDRISPNINLLTTLAQRRIKYLINHQKLSFLEAKKKAKIEVLKAFKIPDTNIKNFDELTIMGNSSGDAVLLAISLSLQGNLLEGELSSFISDIREDLKTDGKIDNQKIYDQICLQTQSLNPLIIRENLIKFYQSINFKDYHIPFFEDYLDSDCDGIINGSDPESMIFSLRSRNDFFDKAHQISFANFNHKVWAYSGSSKKSMQPLVGLYYTEDLKNWKRFEDKENNHLLEIPVMNAHLFPYRNKLILYGGNIHDPYRTFYNEADYFYINNYYFINKDQKLNNLITGIQYDANKNRFYSLNYLKDIKSSAYLNKVEEFWNCTFCQNLLLFQFESYKPELLDRKTLTLKEKYINHSSTQCHKIIKGKNHDLYRFNLKNENCKNYNLHENITRLNKNNEWLDFFDYSEVFHHPIRDEMKELNLSCKIINQPNPYQYCVSKPRSCDVKLNRFMYQCREIFNKYQLKDFDDLFTLHNLQDIIYYKNYYYFIAHDLKENTWNLYKAEDLSSNKIEKLFQLSDKNEKDPKFNQFYVFQDQLFMFNNYGENKASHISSTSGGMNWQHHKLNNYNRYIDLNHNIKGYTAIHNPFIFKNFIHRPLKENKMIIFGKYEHYQSYLYNYFNKVPKVEN